MDMNPQSEVFGKMPPYILTLLKSTEPYLDEYFTLDIKKALVKAGFNVPTITINSPRHRTMSPYNCGTSKLSKRESSNLVERRLRIISSVLLM